MIQKGTCTIYGLPTILESLGTFTNSNIDEYNSSENIPYM